MGLTKEYLRYAPLNKFNLIASINCNVCFIVLDGQEGRYLAVGACEDVFIWDLRLGEKSSTLIGGKHQVTSIAASSDNIHLAVGYADGSINLYDLKTREISTVFTGHRSPISALAFDPMGHRLASGSKDTEIVTWDVISESGLERLSGHKNVVTSVCFLKNKNVLISSSKDTFIKLWDLDTVHCFHTISAHITEIWSLVVIGDDEYIAAGSNDAEIRVWSLVAPKELPPDDDLSRPIVGDVGCLKVGSILRSGRGKTASMCVDNSGKVLCVHGTGPTVELFQFLSEKEAKTRWKKRTAKEQQKATKAGTVAVKTEISLKDVVLRLSTIKCSSRVKSISVIQGSNELRVGASLTNNKIEMFSVSLSNKKSDPVLLRQIAQQGHQGEVRAVAFSSDSLAIASTGSESIKMWNRASLNCLRSVSCEKGVSICFVPGDRHALVGLQNGSLLIVDLAAAEILETVPAHSSELWSVVVLPDKSGVISGGGDNTAKEWKFELVTDENASKAKVLTLRHTRTLQVDDPILCIRVSPCSMYIAVSLLDSTVKIFFLDTFKFFVSLYGHAMPVLCMDISYDSKLIITGSADKSIKIWGLDFGDCHKSLFAHDDAVTAVAFVPNTHYFFSTGKDGKLKQWDAIKFEKIITFDGHFGESLGLSVVSDYVVTCGQDRCLRLYSKTDEILVLEDQQEEERAKEDEQLATGQDSLIPLPSTKTVSAEIGADLLMECLEAISKYKDELKMGLKPTVPPMMAAYKAETTAEYLGKVLQSIRASEMGEVLLLLPFHLVKEMLSNLKELLETPVMCETAIKAAVLLLKVHQKPLESDTSLIGILEKLESTAFNTLANFRDMVGLNLYGLVHIHKDYEEKEGVQLFYEAITKKKDKANRKRRKDKANQAVIMTL